MSAELEENDDKEFELLMMQKHHNELLSAINKLSSVLDNSKVVGAIGEQQDAIMSFAQELKRVVDKPDPDNKAVISAINQMTTRVLSGLSEIKDSLSKREVDLVVNRGYGGLIESISVKPK
jgi:16S rRNA G1207 methylase RsmC